MRIIVTGMVVTYPVGGVAWDYLQYAMGLEQLGHEVYYLEDTGWQVYDPRRQEYGEDYSYGMEFLRRTLQTLSPRLAERWHVRDMNGQSAGIQSDDFANLVRDADLFLNVSGGTLLRDQYMHCPHKVLIDSDPGWNHFVNFPKWDANPGWQGSQGWRAHDHFFTYAERIGKVDCALPLLGIDWQPTRPPVVMDLWRAEPPGKNWTTVMTWNNFGREIEFECKTYGTKEREFVQVQCLPQRVDAKLEIASGGNPPTDKWLELGWSVVNSHDVSVTADAYRHYIQQSRGEFSVAKNLYVATRSGWFSCRSVCYLASGRPVVVQDTGFSELIPAARGLLAFTDLDGAMDSIKRVELDYDRHATAARELAAEHFDARRVLTDLLRRIGLD
jgi:hypothetical protein